MQAEKVIKDVINKNITDRTEELRNDYTKESAEIQYNIKLDEVPIILKIVLSKEGKFERGQIKTVVHKSIKITSKELNMEDVPSFANSVTGALAFLTDDVISGKKFKNDILQTQNNIIRYEKENKSLQETLNRDFEYKEQLEQSKQRVDELTDLMNEEIVAIEKEEERLLMEAGVGGADLDKMQQTNFESEEDEEKEYHKTEKENEPLTEEDIILRDAIIDKLQKLIGKDNVITDSDDAQRIIDTNNDDNSLKENKVYHGSPYQFTEFDHSKMSTGEGRQVFGWGSYVSEIKDIGRHYAQEKRYRSIIKIRNRNGSFDEYDITHVDGFDKDRLSAILKAYEMVCDYDTILQARKAAQYYADRSTDWLDFWQNVCSVLKEHRKSDFSLIHKHGTKNLYTVEIPDDNGRNYLYWEKRVRKDFLRKIAKNLYENKDVIFWVENSTAKDKQRALEKGFWEDYLLRHINNGEDLYNLLESVLGNDKKASGFLSKLGIIGMSYPAGFLHGGNKEGKRNYVIFKEKNLKIIDHIKLFKTKDGNAYGFTANGKIYIDTNIAKADTPIHEYTHLWAKALRENNPKEWQNIVELMKQETFIWDKVKKMYPELKKDENIADEVLAMYSGENGLKKLKEEVAKIKNNNKQNIFDKAMALQAINNINKALEKFWKSVASFFNVHFTNAQDLADTILADFLNGVNPNEYVQETDSKIQSHRTDDKRVKNIIDNIDYERELQNSTLGKPAKKDNEDIPKNLLRKITDKIAVISTKEGFRSFADDYHSLRKDEDMVVENMRKSDKNFRLPKSIYEQQIAANAATNGQIFLFEQQKFAPLLRKIQQICKENNLTQKETEQYLMFLFYPERTAYTIYNRYNAVKEANEKKEKANPRYKKEFEKIKMYIKSLSEGERKQAEEKAMKIFNAKYQDLPFENNDELNEERQKCINEQLARKASEKYRDTELYTIRVKNDVKNINNILIPLSKNDKISGFAGEDDMFNTPLYRTIVEKYFKEEKNNFTATTINPYQITEKFKELVGKDNAEELEQMVKDINSYSLDKALDAGSISDEEYEAYKQNDYYVPLRGWDKDNEIDVFGGDISFQRINPQTKGRKTTADTPLKYLFEIACRQIYESNDKKAKLSLINFYYKYRDILIGENSVAYWTWTDKDGEERHSFERPQRKDVLADSLKFNIMDKEYDRIHSNELKKHLFEFKNGKTTYRLYLKSTYLVNILNSEKNNLPDSMKLIMKGVQNISRTTRYMSAMMTSKNPAFATANFFRDFSSVYFLDERTKDDFPHFNKVFTKNLLNMKTTAKVIFNAKNTYRKENKETLSAKDKELLSLYNQWLHFGGLSGYSYFLQNLDDDFQRRYKEMIKTKGRKVYEGISPLYFEWFNKLSEFTENQVRFAAFRTYLETNPNITVEEAVFRSKEVTLNFSRKGWGTRTFGYFFPFFNATCQGLIKLARLLKYNPLRLIRSFSVFLALGMVDAVLSMYFGGDDDDKDDKEKNRYLQINDYVSERNIILFNTVKIPIPQELYLPFTMGVSLIKAQQGILSGTEASYRILSALGQLLPDEMGSTLGAFAKYDKVHDEITFNDHPFLAVVNALSPGILSPVMDYQTNRDFMGGRILPKEYQKGKIAQAGRYDDYKTYGIYQDAAFVWNNLWNIWHTTKIGQKAGEPISWNRKYYEDLVSQSNKFVDKNGRMFDLSTISPAALQYYVGSYASGLNNILTKVGDMVAGRKEVKTENIPIIDRLAVKHNEHYSLYKKMSLVYDILDNQTTDKKTQDLRDIAQMYRLDTQRFDKITQSKNAEVVRRYNRKKKELQRLSTEIKILKIAGGVKNKKEIDKKLNEQEVIYNDILDGWIAE